MEDLRWILLGIFLAVGLYGVYCDQKALAHLSPAGRRRRTRRIVGRFTILRREDFTETGWRYRRRGSLLMPLGFILAAMVGFISEILLSSSS